MNSGNIKSLIQALPQFRDVLSKLSVHIFISRCVLLVWVFVGVGRGLWGLCVLASGC